MMTSARWRVAWAAGAIAMAGCGFESSGPETGTSDEPIGTDCSLWSCNSNSATVDALPFHDLDLSGREPNDAGLYYVGFEMPGPKRGVELVVKRDRLIAIDAQGVEYTGAQLIGSYLRMKNDRSEFAVRIADVGSTTFWVGRGRVPTYTFEFAAVPGGAPPGDNKEFVHVCGTNPPYDGPPDPEWRGIDRAVALVFEGDRYDARRKTVSDDVGAWFNIACAGSAPAKMHLLRHTAAGRTARYDTRVRDRQAMLKMITDDICGTGLSFTRDGEIVSYMDRGRWHPFDLATVGTLESIWTEDGAVCLDEPRRAAEDASVWGQISAECAPPPLCKDVVADVVDWDHVGYGISANPP
jgi:hypothetical protein